MTIEIDMGITKIKVEMYNKKKTKKIEEWNQVIKT